MVDDNATVILKFKIVSCIVREWGRPTYRTQIYRKKKKKNQKTLERTNFEYETCYIENNAKTDFTSIHNE